MRILWLKDTYLNCFQLVFSLIFILAGTDEKTENFNEPRLCIRKFFPNKKCFIFDRPAQRKFLIHLEHVKEENMNPEFLEQEAEFCSYIFNNSEAKTLSGGITVNGPRESPPSTLS